MLTVAQIRHLRAKHEVTRGQRWLLDNLPVGVAAPNSGFLERLWHFDKRLRVRCDPLRRQWQIWELLGIEQYPEVVGFAKRLDNRVIAQLNARDMARYATRKQAYQEFDNDERAEKQEYEESLNETIEDGIKLCEEYARKSPYVENPDSPSEYRKAGLL